MFCYVSIIHLLHFKLKMTHINLKTMLENVGIQDPKPTQDALDQMGISRRRFTQLSENINKSPMSVHELEAIKNWVNGIRNIDPEEIKIKINDK